MPVDDVDRCRFFRIERDPVADGDNRIEHRALAARERPRKNRLPAHRLRIGDGVASADELHPVGFIGDFSDFRPVHGHQVEHPGRLLALGAGPARAEDRPLLPDDFGLHKKIAERRMQGVRGRRCQNHFRVTGDIDMLCASERGW